MAPAPPAPHPHQHLPHPTFDPPSTLNVFEGPEKKLELRFTPVVSLQTLHPPSIQPCSHTRPPHHGLRMLTRADIESILSAAACTVISVMSNHCTDAYLLSESSLFVSDLHLMIKTCGTTRLLRALPVILTLATDKLDLQLTYVQFSRTSYLFPAAQFAPHDSFPNEVAFLDNLLHLKGKTLETPRANACKWHLYFAHLPPRHPRNSCLSHTPHAVASMHGMSCGSSASVQAMEIYMFDLDPMIMRQFMFHDKRERIGPDEREDGTTVRSGIQGLISEEAKVDAFNFEPCGYSMNAVVDGMYYSIHVSPEEEASYVSFETTVKTELLGQLIASVVRLFRPGRFKVAVVNSGDGGSSWDGEMRKGGMWWGLVTKLVRMQGFRREQLMRFEKYEACNAMVASYALVKWDGRVGFNGRMGRQVDMKDHWFEMRRIGEEYGVTMVGEDGEDLLVGSGEEARVVIDIGRVGRNVRRVCELGKGRNRGMRYVVGSCSDEGVLKVLSFSEVEMEVRTEEELEAVEKVGVPRGRIVLGSAVLTEGLLGKLERVGTVLVWKGWGVGVIQRLKEMGVRVEMRDGAQALGCRKTGLDVSRDVIEGAVSVVLWVIGKRERGAERCYYLNDGMYGALSCVILERGRGEVRPVGAGEGDGECTLFGPTCDAMDWIWRGRFRRLNVGDAVWFRDVGGYCVEGASEFNGFGRRFDVRYVVSRDARE
eukprot:GFKZ01004844.1.p1 GENE.GFKZ01004844.1~~GFKZ01004844.1.p1  ORF type:complete len:710 (+),score=97.24 GFKZ01004844.1:316-2445(+)